MLRNSIPVSQAKELIDEYEITPAYEYKLTNGQAEVMETPYVVKDDEGTESYSLLSPPVVIALLKQLYSVLIEKK